jgi:diaminohydroxyphosphoribosylaminopyrimidine deaminase/5-amino-6-(5-phosphoribosylamino)uracil reductase
MLTSTSAPSARIADLNANGVDVETVPDHAGRLSLPAVLEALAERNVLSLLLECGSHLNGAFLRQNLVDKAVLFYSETELGDQAIPFAQGINSPYHFEMSLRRVTRSLIGRDACVTGYLHNPWPSQLTAN